MKNITESVPLRVIHHDSTLLVVQTLTHLAGSQTQDLLSELSPSSQSNQSSPSNLLPIYGDFNVGLHVADNPVSVLHNRCKLLAELCRVSNQSISTIHWLNQVHGHRVYDVDGIDTGDDVPVSLPVVNVNVKSRQSAYKPVDADALTTMQQGQALAIMTADCVPIVLSCEDSGRIAGIHAGWHGLAKGVIAETAKKFKSNGDAEKIHAWIGACISQANYEVTTDVLEKLIEGTLNNFTEPTAESLLQAITKPHVEPHKVWIDLPQLAKIQLQTLGIEVMTTHVPCSYADNNYYSHRLATHSQQKHTGRMALLVCRLVT